MVAPSGSRGHTAAGFGGGPGGGSAGVFAMHPSLFFGSGAGAGADAAGRASVSAVLAEAIGTSMTALTGLL